MRELGVTCHSEYKVTLLMDHKSMVTVKTDKYGMVRCGAARMLLLVRCCIQGRT